MDTLLHDGDFISIFSVEIARLGIKGEQQMANFRGLIPYMHTSECNHKRPHFHVKDAEDEASIDILTMETLAGSLKRRRLSLVQDWASRHKQQLSDNWRNLMDGLPLEPIGPFAGRPARA